MNLQLCLCPLLVVRGRGGRGCDGTNVRVALQEFEFQVFCEETDKEKELGLLGANL